MRFRTARRLASDMSDASDTARPSDRQIDLRLTHQTPVMHDAKQPARQHQPDLNLGRKPGHPVCAL